MLTVVWYRKIFGAICVLATLDWATRIWVFGDRKVLYSILAVWFVGVLLQFTLRWARLGSVLMIPSALAIVYLGNGQLYSQHVYLLVSYAAILGLARDREVNLILRIQLTLAYAFSVLAKVNEAYLSGDSLWQHVVHRPFWATFLPTPTATVLITLAVIALLTEAFLGFALWFRPLRYVALVVGLGFHAALVIFVTDTVLHTNRLIVFALLMLMLYPAFFEDDIRKYWPIVRDRLGRRKPLIVSP